MKNAYGVYQCSPSAYLFAELHWLVVIDCPTTVGEILAVHLIVGQFNAVIAVVYRSGSDAVQSAFYEELIKVFEN